MAIPPGSRLEFWFRKAEPTSFEELIDIFPDATKFWAVSPAVSLHEMGNEYPETLCDAYYCCWENRWQQNGVFLQLGHGDLVVSNGPLRFAAVLISPTWVPSNWGTRHTRLAPNLSMLALGMIR